MIYDSCSFAPHCENALTIWDPANGVGRGGGSFGYEPDSAEYNCYKTLREPKAFVFQVNHFRKYESECESKVPSIGTVIHIQA